MCFVYDLYRKIKLTNLMVYKNKLVSVVTVYKSTVVNSQS